MKNITQPPYNTTLMSTLKGIADYYAIVISKPMLYGISGHAFLINIHDVICPSSPYCWNMEHALPLIENTGLKMTHLGFFSAESNSASRARIEKHICSFLDAGICCSLINMENQIIKGYDKTGFFLTQPWDKTLEITPVRLSFRSWQECGQEIHMCFYTIEKAKSTDRKKALIKSLEYAVDVWENPGRHAMKGYAIGPHAYENWIHAIPKHGATHGNWWNAMVWSECRHMAAQYMAEIATLYPHSAELCTPCVKEYETIAQNLEKVGANELQSEEKISILKETQKIEAVVIKNIQKVISSL